MPERPPHAPRSAPARKRSTPPRASRPAASRNPAGKRRHLVIVESPAKAETIGRFLGDDYLVDACYGHIRDLPGSAEERPDWLRGKPWADLAVNVDEDFTPVYVVPPEKRAHVERLRQQMKQADKLLLATDEDREGESIGWHLLQVLKPTVPVERIVFHEVTREAIAEALAHPRQVDDNLVEAQESRRILDRLYGYRLSPVLWRKIQAGLSAGRVQSVAVRVLVQRERERAAFVRADYWDLTAALEAGGGRFSATLRRLGDARLASGRDFDATTGKVRGRGVRLLTEREARALAQSLRTAQPWTVTRVETSPASSRPAPPFTTSTLQQEANRKLGFSAQRTMAVAQSLYEGIDVGAEREGLITYMRTDSVTLAQQMLTEAQTLIQDRFGADYAAGPRFYKTRIRNAQEAHEAIRPTQLVRSPQSLDAVLSSDQRRLYELIWERTLASQMPDARLERTTVEASVASTEGPAVFETRGRRVIFPGYLRAYQESTDEEPGEADFAEQLLPPVQQGDTLTVSSLEPRGHETQPPARYTEASLVRKLEEDGLGRPSTYASILSTIQDRGYVFKQGNALAPTFVAYAVTELLERHFSDLVEADFTAAMEETLDAIARGETDSVSHLRQFYRGTDGIHGLEQRIEQQLPEIPFPQIPVGVPSESGEEIVVRIGRYGPYLQQGEGGAGKTASLPREIAPADLSVQSAQELLSAKQEGPRTLGRDPDTGLDVLLRSGRYGPYVQRGPNPPARTKKADLPRRASVPAGMAVAEVTLEDALLWLSLPRALGGHPETGEPVVAASGRFGPYIQCGSETRSLTDQDDVYTIGLDRALALLAQPKSAGFRRQQAQPLRELGAHPGSGARVRLLSGRFGPYVTDGATNASLPRGADPDQITLEQALTLLAERAAQGPRKSAGRKKTARAGGTGGETRRGRTPARKPSSR